MIWRTIYLRRFGPRQSTTLRWRYLLRQWVISCHHETQRRRQLRPTRRPKLSLKNERLKAGDNRDGLLAHAPGEGEGIPLVRSRLGREGRRSRGERAGGRRAREP